MQSPSTFLRPLPFIHYAPVYKPVAVQDKKRNKTNYHGQIRNMSITCHAPHNYEHYIVCTVKQRIETASSRSQIRRQKRREYGNCADYQVRGIQSAQYKVKRHCYYYRRSQEQTPFPAGNAVDFNLAPVSVIGVSKPRNQRPKRNGRSHTQVGYHFPVVFKRKGNNAVKHAENYR